MLCDARQAQDPEWVAGAADLVAGISTGRAQFRDAAQARHLAATSSWSRERAQASRVAIARARIADDYPADMLSTREVLRVAKRTDIFGPRREEDLVLLAREAGRSSSIVVLNAAAGAARGCAEPELAASLLARSLTISPSIAENPGAYVTLTALLNDLDARLLRPFARDLGAALEHHYPDDVAVHRVALVTWKQLGNRDEIRRHARAIDRAGARRRS